MQGFPTSKIAARGPFGAKASLKIRVFHTWSYEVYERLIWSIVRYMQL